jgi:hypothetical protein
MAWIVNAGDIEFYRINSQYRGIVASLEAERITSAAIDELTGECLSRAKRSAATGKDCYTWPPAAVEARSLQITERLKDSKRRGLIKVILFYTGFVILFLVGPPVFIYLLLIGVIKLFRSIKFVRNGEQNK